MLVALDDDKKRKQYLICSKHFAEDARVQDVRKSVNLRADAMPTIDMPG